MTYPFENKKLGSKIKINNLFRVEKMEDIFLTVRFKYGRDDWNGAIPIFAKYQGIAIPLTEDDIYEWVNNCYSKLAPSNYSLWKQEQETFWDSNNSNDTHIVFDALVGNEGLPVWRCRKCGPVPQSNPQSASRIRYLKMLGYTIATDKKVCPSCGKTEYFDLLIPLPRQAANNQKRFSIPKALRKKILSVLPNVDCCFERPLKSNACIIDHKFPSSRWVNGETINQTSMSSEEIINKFQILSNQTNLQKEKYCQRCVLQNIRGDFFGIIWYYLGNQEWQGTSKADENGCIGCPWYDLMRWKKAFNDFLNDNNSSQS